MRKMLTIVHAERTPYISVCPVQPQHTHTITLTSFTASSDKVRVRMMVKHQTLQVI